jgi:hypothetical protein
MMPYRRHAANHRCCIHCQGTHASEDHHLSLTVPVVSNSGYPVLLPIQEQIETSTNDGTPHSYKKTQFSLPSQQFTFATHQKQQWPLPPRPTPPTASRPSMGVNTSSASTRRSQISSTTSHTSTSPPHCTFRPAPALPTNKKGRRSSSSSRRKRARIRTLWALLDMAENNDMELQGLYEDSPVTADADWGTFTWGPIPQWEEPPPADDPPPA